MFVVNVEHWTQKAVGIMGCMCCDLCGIGGYIRSFRVNAYGNNVYSVVLRPRRKTFVRHVPARNGRSHCRSADKREKCPGEFRAGINEDDLMKVLVACEESQTVCKAFRLKGHDAFSCDIQEPSGGHPEWHILGDAVKAIEGGKY